ncbi:MAG: glycosyltransferase family 2 protein [Synergistaceae bacterium]|jgi:glycosyltransferase involved in cell wall biosynthesis|nr:glycosyltransferase family 2 protein [Synergistaceae bacterium]
MKCDRETLIDPDICLLFPKKEIDSPELTILVPALNESLTIGEFVGWCIEGVNKAGVRGEILIVDSSTDNTSEIALASGARVLKTPKRGLGRAYIDALPFARGKYLILGDCDLTYDFREIAPFVEAMRSGADFVMGSRFSGYIEENAMPKLHRYFGTPLTTWILNRLYGTRFSDIHCGMRGITKDAFEQMRMESQSWEYASEMVIKAAKLRMKIEEVPIRFYKDREGRLSHHRRSGWLSPWRAGWINLKAMLLHAPDFFFLKPGLFLFVIGLILTFLGGTQSTIGALSFRLHWMLLGVCVTLVGFSSFQIGVIGKLWHGYHQNFELKSRRFFSYNKGMLCSTLSFILGLILITPSLYRYLREGLTLPDVQYTGVFGLLLIILGFQIFGFAILCELISTRKRR